MITNTVSAAGMSATLKAFAEEVGAGPKRRIVLVIDGAGWHTAPDVVVPEGVHLIFQPPYSPQVQPAERLWPLVREVLANRDFKDINEHSEVTSRRCREITDQPEAVRRHCSLHWWPQDHIPLTADQSPERAAS